MDLTGILGGLAPHVGSGIGGALGKGIGSALGPLGSWAGGLIGGLGGNLAGNLAGSYFTGGNNSQQQPQQMNSNPAFYDQLQQAQSGLLNQLQQRPQFQPVDINPILQGTRQEFDQRVIPSIMERFSGMGQGGQRSSSFRNALGAAGSGLSQKLAELQSSHARDQQSQMMQNRGQDLQQMGLLGNFVNQQNMLGQNQNQFNQQQQNTAPYWLNPLANGLGSLGNIWSGSQNRAVQGELGQQNSVSNAQNTGLGRQAELIQHARQKGIVDYGPDSAIGAVKALFGIK